MTAKETQAWSSLCSTNTFLSLKSQNLLMEEFCHKH